MSGRSWSAGRGCRESGGLTGPGSSWRVPGGCRMPKPRGSWEWRSGRGRSGGAQLPRSGWTGLGEAAQRLAGLEDAAPVGRRSAPLVLDEAERAQLIRWARRAKTAQFLALRAKIVLRCAEGGTNREAAADLGVDESTGDPGGGRV